MPAVRESEEAFPQTARIKEQYKNTMTIAENMQNRFKVVI